VTRVLVLLEHILNNGIGYFVVVVLDDDCKAKVTDESEKVINGHGKAATCPYTSATA